MGEQQCPSNQERQRTPVNVANPAAFKDTLWVPKDTKPIRELFAIWRAEAERDFERDEDSVLSTFSSANRLGSGSQIVALMHAAEAAAMSLLRKAQNLPLDPRHFSIALEEASLVFDNLAERVRGRSRPLRLQDAGQEVYHRALLAGHEHLQAEVSKWKLELLVRNRRGAYQREKGDLPSEEVIRAKMLELMQDRRISRDRAAILIRSEPGFDAVTNTLARAAVAGHLPRGRPSKNIVK